MKTFFLGTTALAAVAFIQNIEETHAQNNGRVGGINLQIANVACAAVSPQTATGINPNPSDLNDNDLDEPEILALQEGCTLRAIAIDEGGNRISGEQLTLLRGEAPVGSFFPFGYSRTTDARGEATWRFHPTPNTDFSYEVVSAGRTQPRLTSNTVEIQLCTGEDSVDASANADNLVPTNDAGMGCQYLNNRNNGRNTNNSGDNNDDVIVNPVQ